MFGVALHCSDGETERRLSVKQRYECSKNAIARYLPPKFDTVLSRVIYVPPIRGSLTFALNAIIDTNMLYNVTCNDIVRSQLLYEKK